MNKDLYWSNCFIEAIRAKIKHGKEVEIIHLPARDNEIYCTHWMWHDLVDNKVYDFHSINDHDHWWNFIIFKGYIRVRPYEIWERWLSK